jgi:photosystem II stability/assembly factor-like uncharacterized protein
VHTGGDLAGVASVAVLKTEDGGESWREVLIPDLSAYGYVDITFVNANRGYVIFSNQLFATSDAGETWSLIGTTELYNFIVTPDNNLFAVLPDRQDAIITSHNGEAWRTLATFPNPVRGIGFSPSSAVGFAVVYASQDTFVIYKTHDNGQIWIKEETFNMGRFHFGRVYVSPDNVAYLHLYDPYSELDDRLVKYVSLPYPG